MRRGRTPLERKGPPTFWRPGNVVGSPNWDDLMEGKYGWSSIGEQLREKSLVK